jgi:hypothetical protein
MLDWQGMLSLCLFKKDMVVVQTGAICDNLEKAILKTNRSKLRSKICMLDISEVTVLIPQVRLAHKYPIPPWEMIHPTGGDNPVRI